MSNSTLTVQQVVNYSAQHTELMPLVGVGGIANEPALSIANDTLQELLAEKFPWKFNRVTGPVFVTSPNKQDYKYTGAVAFTLNGGGCAIGLASANAITESSFTVTVNLLESCTGIFNVGDTVFMTGNTVAAYNSVFTQTPSSSAWTGGWTIVSIAGNGLSFTFTHASSGLANSGAPGITNFGWLEEADFVRPGDTASPQQSWPLEAVRTLKRSSFVTLPTKMSVQADDGAGTLTVRLFWVPGSVIYMVTPIYQAAPTPLTLLSNTWAPFPDKLAFIIRQMFLAMCYRFMESPKEPEEYQKALAMMEKSKDSDDREASEEFISPETTLMGGFSGWNGWSL